MAGRRRVTTALWTVFATYADNAVDFHQNGLSNRPRRGSEQYTKRLNQTYCSHVSRAHRSWLNAQTLMNPDEVRGRQLEFYAQSASVSLHAKPAMQSPMIG